MLHTTPTPQVNPPPAPAATPTTTSSDHTCFPITILNTNSKTYSNWASRMHGVLKVNRIWDIIEDVANSGIAKLLDTDPTYSDWLDKDERAFTYLRCYVSDPCLSMIHNKLGAHEAWKTLSERFVRKDKQDMHMLHTSLHHYRLDDTKPLGPQFQEMEDTCLKVASLGLIISNKSYLSALIHTTPQSYHTLKSIATMQMK
jgi:hypothetical protein